MQKRREYKEAKVTEMNRNVFLLRKSLCGSLFSIFPVSEVIAQTVRPAGSTTQADDNCNGRWTMVGGHQIEEGPMIKVRDTFLSEAARERLGAALSDSLLNLTPELRSPFAAFLLSLQLVSNIAAIFDFRLPYLINEWDTCEDLDM
ncbi:hypothetical protein GCK32_003180 [Trichostrongylus colubriformis]|uniref:Uncharacterized protein n=1 Tax=Trichostrongylus colubriformis TaxID=6319 RepID=A0AAN8FXQ7_TRICO